MPRLILCLTLLALALTACGNSAPATESSNAPAAASPLPATLDVQTVAGLKERGEVILLDVREPWEYEEAHIADVTLIPMGEVPQRLAEIPTDQPVVVTCRSGNRSEQVAELLRQQGYTNVHNMEGGLNAWQAAGLPVEQ